MPHGRRCDLGCVSWPDSDEYNVCAACDEKTSRYRNLNPMGEVEAARLRSDLLFEDFYEARCVRRGVTTDGPMGPRPSV